MIALPYAGDLCCQFRRDLLFAIPFGQCGRALHGAFRFPGSCAFFGAACSGRSFFHLPDHAVHIKGTVVGQPVVQGKQLLDRGHAVIQLRQSLVLGRQDRVSVLLHRSLGRIVEHGYGSEYLIRGCVARSGHIPGQGNGGHGKDGSDGIGLRVFQGIVGHLHAEIIGIVHHVLLIGHVDADDLLLLLIRPGIVRGRGNRRRIAGLSFTGILSLRQHGNLFRQGLQGGIQGYAHTFHTSVFVVHIGSIHHILGVDFCQNSVCQRLRLLLLQSVFGQVHIVALRLEQDHIADFVLDGAPVDGAALQ